MPSTFDPDGILGKATSNDYGYDEQGMNNAVQAHEAKTGDEKGFLKVDPLFIPVSDGVPVREEEWEARSVIIEYDAYDNIVSVELL